MDVVFDSVYHSLSDNAAINSSGSVSPNSSATEQLKQKFLEDSSMKNECSNFDDLCVYESIMDSCTKPCDILEARDVLSAVIVSSAVKFKPTKHQCPVCGKTYRGNTNLNYHMVTQTGIRPHKCSICGKAFTQKSTLRTHFQIHTGEKPYKCRTCTVHLRTTPPA
ncbi:zinc finger protein 596-like [Crassostrea angulata]|uniref:Zinc finger protein 1-like protein n=1 Tax=Magallana gigas TaxID=29159 RepID=K1RG32_MAGGI|nr:zinc finger protein 596-like [Crassostrea angulata]|eukprot:XP_011439021.1 PREDICTED: zinc finger protein 596 [Crassostrea gigas]